MGSKESKLKKAFEEIDESGDKKVSPEELADFFNSGKAEKLLKKMSSDEIIGDKDQNKTYFKKCAIPFFIL